MEMKRHFIFANNRKTTVVHEKSTLFLYLFCITAWSFQQYATFSKNIEKQFCLQKFLLTWVEVFGFGQFNSGTSLFLQLYDGLTALANYRAGCIAGDQHLQEVLTLLWGIDIQSGKGSNLGHKLDTSSCSLYW